MIRRSVALMLPLLLSACDPLGLVSYSCTDEGNYAIVASVRDAATDTLLTGATLTIQDGEFRESTSGGFSLAAGAEREGVYDVTVERAGFETWRRENVAVRREGRCEDLKTVRLTARLRAIAATSPSRSP